jgi:hypothetical protein
MSYLPVPNNVTDLRPNAFSSGAGNAVSKSLVSEFDVFPRNEWNQLFLRHNPAPHFKTILMSMGFGLPNSKDGYGHYEKPWDSNNIVVGAVIAASGGAGQQHVISIAALDHYQTSQFSGATQLYGTQPIQQDIWQVLGGPNNGVQVYIEAKDTTTVPSAHRLTLRPVDGTVDLAAPVVAANTVLQYVSNAFAEGTGLPQGKTPRVIRYQNTTQIVKTAAVRTGTEMATETVLSPSGETYYMAVVDPAMKNDHMTACSGALLWGQPTTNTAIKQAIANQGYDAAVATTEGFIPSLENYAQQDTYTVGAFATDDFDDLSGLLLQQRGNAHAYNTFEGYAISQETENVLNDVFQYDLANALAERAFGDSRINYAENTNYFSPKDFVASFGYKATKKGGCTYFFMTLPEFTSPVGGGASGSPYPNYRLVAPIDLSAKDEQGNVMPSFGYRYSALAGYSREMMVGTIIGAGAAQGEVSNEFDQKRAWMISDTGFHIIAPNQFGLQIPA